MKFTFVLVVVCCLLGVALASPVGTLNPTRVIAPIAKPNTTPTDVVLFDAVTFTSANLSYKGQYTPPTCNHVVPDQDLKTDSDDMCSLKCIDAAAWGLITVEISASVSGVQFDRYGGLWVGGLELQRITTAEPPVDQSLITWSTEKDVTEFASHLACGHSTEISVPNYTTNVYTGILTYNVTLHFYPRDTTVDVATSDLPRFPHVIPLSTLDPTASNPWNSITAAFDSSTTTANITYSVTGTMQNADRAYIVMYASGHSCEEFWYTNPPTWYAKETGNCGGGAYRQLTVLIDDNIAGVVQPFPVLYSGGANPLFWKPIIGIETLDVGPYKVDVTPFVGLLNDGKAHEITFRVETTQSTGVWYMTGSVLLYKSREYDVVTSKVDSVTGGLPLVHVDHTVDPKTNATTFTTTSTTTLTVSATIYGSNTGSDMSPTLISIDGIESKAEASGTPYSVNTRLAFTNVNLMTDTLGTTTMSQQSATEVDNGGTTSAVECEYPFYLSVYSAQDATTMDLAGNVTYGISCAFTSDVSASSAAVAGDSRTYVDERSAPHVFEWGHRIVSTADYNRTLVDRHINDKYGKASAIYAAGGDSLQNLCYVATATGFDGDVESFNTHGNSADCNAQIKQDGGSLRLCGNILCPDFDVSGQ
eukprot:GFYU01015795.1.p1 GENE.GFYU01015795.1~~GFYU01015795.1.p1  ORF type:complete len:646 (-),score=166.61 GFYU01015795.1:86-2023(-)